MIQWVKKEAGDDSPGQYYIDENGVEQFSATGPQVDEWDYGPEEKYNEDLGLAYNALKSLGQSAVQSPALVLALAAAASLGAGVGLWLKHSKKAAAERVQREKDIKAKYDAFLAEQKAINPAFKEEDVAYVAKLQWSLPWKGKVVDVEFMPRAAA